MPQHSIERQVRGGDGVGEAIGSALRRGGEGAGACNLAVCYNIPLTVIIF